MSNGEFKATVVTDSGISHVHDLGPLFEEIDDGWRFLNAVKPFVYSSDSYMSRTWRVEHLRKTLRYFAAIGIVVVPSSPSEWQSAVNKVYEYHLSHERPTYSLDSRVNHWKFAIRPMLEYLRDVAELIPPNTKIPPK